nr:hypothetical protein [Tanacetum cinerariifolium]
MIGGDGEVELTMELGSVDLICGFNVTSADVGLDLVFDDVCTCLSLSHVWMSSGYDVLDFVSSWFLVKCRHIYAVSSLLDTAYGMSERVYSQEVGLSAVDSKMSEVDINTLTMELYLALTRGNQALGMVKPKIGGNVNFGIKNQFMRELRKDTFLGNKNDDAHEHVERILDIVSLFNISGVAHDAFMLRVFSITLAGFTKRWVDRLLTRTINTWDMLKKAFI